MIDQDKMRALAKTLRAWNWLNNPLPNQASDAIDLLLAEVEQNRIDQLEAQGAFEEMDLQNNHLRAELEAAAADKRELSALLPGPYYMDPPDGGDVSLIEQLRRMAKDAERYRLLHGCHDDFDILHWRNAGWKSTSGRELDEAIDALAQRQGEGS